MWCKIMPRLATRITALSSPHPLHPRQMPLTRCLQASLTSYHSLACPPPPRPFQTHHRQNNGGAMLLFPNHTSRSLSTTITTPRALPDYQIARKPLEQSITEGSRFPWMDEFELSREVKVDAQTLISTLGPLMTEERLERIEKVCSNRTFDILPIVEHPYDLGNLAAVCRSADALGCGAVHVIRNASDERFKQSARTSGGAEKWLDIQLHSSTAECL